ncbi:MAG TPA: FAD-dependent oxidoreductase, partial [Actinopolymorphaceae bacterium]|nr:FAD-dependent oxidoreductase [Actinopolymorphaceae bacterium]
MPANADSTFVVIGASVAGGTAVETLRTEGFDGRIVLVGEEAELPYERPPLSKGVLQGNDEPSVVFLKDAAYARLRGFGYWPD